MPSNRCKKCGTEISHLDNVCDRCYFDFPVRENVKKSEKATEKGCYPGTQIVANNIEN
jgi:NMD protein affecting ribosome stability and mRNA decay